MPLAKQAAEVFNAMPIEQQAAANSAFSAAADVLKQFGVPVAYDDRAERLVHHIAVFMKECAPDDPPASSDPT